MKYNSEAGVGLNEDFMSPALNERILGITLSGICLSVHVSVCLVVTLFGSHT